MCGKTKVLVVDDEKLITDSLVLILANEGYEARPAYSAEEALELLRDWQPAIAIIDVLLPGMNGIDLAIAIESAWPSVRLLLISGQMISTTLLDAAAAQGRKFDVFAKPVPVEVLLEQTAKLTAQN
jgi:DNA-binding NtrC family response regulator